MPKRFTLPEAESLLPELEKVMREAISLKSEFEEAESSVQAVTQRVIMMGGVLVDRQAVLENKHRRDRTAAQLKTSLETIQEFGCVVKDLDIGLVDFPTEFRGQEVYLCWKLGEAGIQFWHGVHEGFAGRKPIDQDFLEHHKGDAAN
jgi:hypothetical protein